MKRLDIYWLADNHRLTMYTTVGAGMVTVENRSVLLAPPRFATTPLLSLRSAHVPFAPTCWPSVNQALGRKCMKHNPERETERPREREEERLMR